jgi:hypothetical protein
MSILLAAARRGVVRVDRTDFSSILYVQDFESLDVDEDATNLPNLYNFHPSPRNALGSDVQAFSGSRSVRTTAGPAPLPSNDPGLGLTVQVNQALGASLVIGDEVWCRWRVWIPSQGLVSNPHLKWFRIRELEPGGTTSPNRGWTDLYLDSPSPLPNHRPKLIQEFENQWVSFSNGVPQGNQSGTDVWDLSEGWHTFEVHIKLDHRLKSAGGDPIFRVWKDGAYLGDGCESSLMKTAEHADSIFREIGLVPTWNSDGDAPAVDTTLYIDDIALAVNCSSRDDTPHLAADIGGRKYIGVE